MDFADFLIGERDEIGNQAGHLPDCLSAKSTN
jgi:hypothetical protein